MKQRRLNIRLLAGLILGGGIFVVGVHWLHGYQVGRKADSLVRRADQKREDGDLVEAVRLRDRYVRHRPDDAEQWKAIARDAKDLLMLTLEDGTFSPELWQQVREIVEQSVRHVPDDLEMRRMAADLYIQLGALQGDHYQAAVDHLQFVRTKLQKQGEPFPPADTVNLARCYYLLGHHRSRGNANADSDGARATASGMLAEMIGYDLPSTEFDAAKATAPQHLDAYVVLASILAATDLTNTERADAVIQQMVAANPEDPMAYLNRANYWQRVHRTPEGFELVRSDIQQAAQLAPEREEVMMAQIQLAFSDRKSQEARQLLETALTKFPDNPSVYTYLAQLSIQDDNLDQAADYIRKGLRNPKLKNNWNLIWELANLQLAREQFSEYESYVQQLKKVGVARQMLELLEAKRLFIQENWEQCSAKLEQYAPMLTSVYRHQADLLLERCYGRMNQPDKQREIQDRILDRTGSLSMLISRADTLANLGRLEDAIQQLQALLEQLEQQESSELQLLASQARRKLAGYYLKAEAQKPLEERNFTQLQPLLARVMADPAIEANDKAAMKLEELIVRGQTDQARSVVRQAQREYPADMNLWRVRLRLANTNDEVLLLLDEMEKQIGDTVAMRLVRAEQIVRLNGSPEDLRALEANLQDFEQQESYQLRNALARCYYLLNARPEAKRLWEQLAAERPRDLNIQLLLFDVAKAGQNEPEMLAALDRMEKISGRTSDEWRIARATYLAWKMLQGPVDPRALSEARQLVESVRQNRPQWPVLFQVEAELYVQAGELPRAIDALEQAYNLQPNDPLLTRRLVELLTRAERHNEANQVLLSASREALSLIDVQQQISILDESGNLQQALELAGRSHNDEPEALNTYARLLLKANDPDQAIAVLQRSLRRDSDVPDTWLAMLDAARHKGDQHLIDTVLQEAQLRLAVWQVPIFLGEAYRRMGDLAQAQHELTIAVTTHPENRDILRRMASLHLSRGQTSQAEDLLERIVELSQEDDATLRDEDARWARRSLARVWASPDSLVPLEQVADLLKANTDGEFLAPEDEWTYISLFAARPEYRYRQVALQRLARRSLQELNDNELLLLIELQESFGQWNAAKNNITEFLGRPAVFTKTQITSRCVDWLIEHQEYRDLATWLSNLDPKSLPAAKAQVHLLVKDNKLREAIDLLTAMVPSNLPREKASLLLTVGRWMEELGERDSRFFTPSAALIGRYVSIEPQAWTDLCRVLSKQKQPEALQRAIQICTKAMEAGKTTEAVAAAVEALRQNRGLVKSQPQLVQHVEALFQRAPVSPETLLQRAYFADVQDKGSEAEEAYRQYLQQPGLSPVRQSVVKNNLAYALASRGETKESMRLVQEALEQFGPAPQLLDTRALIHLAAGSFENAITDLEGALAAGGSSAEYLFHMAWARAGTGETELAREALEQAIGQGLTRDNLNASERQQLDRLTAQLGLTLARS